ncbi:MAG: peptidylprolyl isomerase [Candidatus Sumerlaeota bacterium]|nr:peptidylprolyl isomerase [Candidatus Sumerlaeota bacterium]
MKKCRLRVAILVVLTAVSWMTFGMPSVTLGQNTDTKKEELKKEGAKETIKEEPVNMDAIVARWGDRVIKEGDVRKEMDKNAPYILYPARSVSELPKEEQMQYRRKMLNFIIDRRLIQDSAGELKVVVNDEDTSKGIADIKKHFPDEQAFASALKQQQMTAKDLESDIRRDMTIRKVIDTVTATTPTVTEQEVANYYKENPERFKQPEEVWASHILVSADKNASIADREAARKKIEALRKRLLAGEDFAQLAKDNSDCPSGKRAGGDLGWFKRGRMLKEFENVAFALKLGELSDIVETPVGYHIIKVHEKHAERVISLEEVKGDLRRDLITKKKGEVFERWLTERKKQVVFTNQEDKDIPKEEVKK